MRSLFPQDLLCQPLGDAADAFLVATEGARAVGFIGVVPRPMRLRGRALQAAVVTQLMVDLDSIERIAAFVERKKVPLAA